MAKEAKQVSIHLSRALLIHRAGKETVSLTAGRNMVDEDVAKHPLVEAHSSDAPVEIADVKALEAENAALRKQVEDQAAVIAAYEAAAKK